MLVLHHTLSPTCYTIHMTQLSLLVSSLLVEKRDLACDRLRNERESPIEVNVMRPDKPLSVIA